MKMWKKNWRLPFHATELSVRRSAQLTAALGGMLGAQFATISPAKARQTASICPGAFRDGSELFVLLLVVRSHDYRSSAPAADI